MVLRWRSVGHPRAPSGELTNAVRSAQNEKIPLALGCSRRQLMQFMSPVPSSVLEFPAYDKTARLLALHHRLFTYHRYLEILNRGTELPKANH
jgi:hypothetical protein